MKLLGLFGVLAIGLFTMGQLSPTNDGYVLLNTTLNVNSTASATTAVRLWGHKHVTIQGYTSTGTWTTVGVVSLERSNDGIVWVSGTTGDQLAGPGLRDSLPAGSLFVRLRTTTTQGTTAVGQVILVGK